MISGGCNLQGLSVYGWYFARTRSAYLPGDQKKMIYDFCLYRIDERWIMREKGRRAMYLSEEQREVAVGVWNVCEIPWGWDDWRAFLEEWPFHLTFVFLVIIAISPLYLSSSVVGIVNYPFTGWVEIFEMKISSLLTLPLLHLFRIEA